MNELAWMAAGGTLLAAGFVFSVIPPLPGVLMAYGALWCAYGMEPPRVQTWELAAGAAAVAVSWTLDFIVPAVGGRLTGGSRWGFWGGIAGLLVGLLFAGIGVLPGYFIGIFVGELLHARDLKRACKAWAGSALGYAGCTILRLLFCLGFLAWFVSACLPRA